MALHMASGDVLVGLLKPDGTVDYWRDLREAPLFEVALKVDKEEDFETSSGLNKQILSAIVKQTAELSITLKEPTAENIAFICYGTDAQTIAAATKTARPFPTPLVAGKIYSLPDDMSGIADTGLTIVDSAPTPRTLVKGTDYILDQTFGTIIFTQSAITGSTQPFKITGQIAGEIINTLFSKTPANVAVRLHVRNRANNFAKEIWEFYNCQFDPTDKLTGKSKSPAEFAIKGAILADTTKPNDGLFGQFGRIRKLNAA